MPIVLCLPDMLGQLVELISDGTISGRIAKDVFADMFESGKMAQTIVDEKGLNKFLIVVPSRRLIDQVLMPIWTRLISIVVARTNFLAFLSVR